MGNRQTIATLVILALLLAACGGEHKQAKRDPAPPPVRELESEMDGWTHLSGPPAWLLSPPRREGWVRIVDASQSNVLDLTIDADPGYLLALAKDHVAWRLRPVLGDLADAAAGGVSAPGIVKQAYHFDREPPRAEPTIGGSTYTAWVLREVPLEPILAAVPTAHHAAVKEILEGASRTAAVPWEVVESKPTWADLPPAREGHVRIVIRDRSRNAAVAKANGELRAAAFVTSRIQGRLKPVLGGRLAYEVARHAATWRVLLRRAVHGPVLPPRGGTSLAYDAWQLLEIPLGPILGAVPEEHREAAEAALTTTPDR